ncbi:hypothetical protein DFH08DRAFT_978093 [Mycena albidolilacea]|uniref:Uncharacterized protein n=1 Tax=Mycena albidolilacea TaxID=1033008 RepID=A0AAD7E8T4_9AGAR|nr:hypothetical protein DFH08DRAFT_978093 [Mycena albidolilacea]
MPPTSLSQSQAGAGIVRVSPPRFSLLSCFYSPGWGPWVVIRDAAARPVVERSSAFFGTMGGSLELGRSGAVGPGEALGMALSWAVMLASLLRFGPHALLGWRWLKSALRLRRRLSPTLESGLGALRCRRGTHHHICAGLVSFSLLFRSFLLLAPPDGRSSAHALAMGAAPSFLCACIGVLVYSVASRQTVDATHRLDSGGAPHTFSFKFMYCPNAPRASGSGRLPYTQPHSLLFSKGKIPKSSLLPSLVPCSVNYRDFVSSLVVCDLELMLLWCHCAASLLIGPSDASVRF